MSDLNDELLNYEIGDVEADGTELTGADEDELLLSDDESFACKLSQEQEEDLLSEAEPKQNKSLIQDENSSTVSASEIEEKTKVNAPIESKKKPAEAVINRRTLIRTSSKRIAAQKQQINKKNETSEITNVVTIEEVSSTNKEDEEKLTQSSSPACSSATQESQVSSQPDECDQNSECIPIIGDSDKDNINETSDNKSESVSESVYGQSQDTQSSQLTSEDASIDNSLGVDGTDFEAEDSDEVSERRNAKTCVEREQRIQHEESNRPAPPQQHLQHFQRNRGGPQFGNPRLSMLRSHHPYRMPHSGENFNPSFLAQFRPQNQVRHPGALGMQGPRGEFLGGHPNNLLRPFHRMPMHGMPPHSRLPMPPSQQLPGPHGMPPHRLQRPPFQSSGGQPSGNNSQAPPFRPMFNNNNQGMPPGQVISRPRMNILNPHLPQRQPFQPFTQQTTHPGNLLIHRAPLHPQQVPVTLNQNMQPTAATSQLPPITRKVLLNPNFKGGVQAATDQLMRDTMKNSQLAVNREAELLRQQEAFINQNRMHIEKRRRSREYSPDRERSYSPPARRRANSRERDTRKPYVPYRGNRGRRANSRDIYENEHKHFESKRRRSGSFERDGDNAEKKGQKTDEDEETRAYRLEIEKQKAMREKILRDKEMRRRKAAEDIKKDEDKKPVDDSAQKLTPIIVTEKKIISLKKKPDQMGQSASDQSSLPTIITTTAQASVIATASRQTKPLTITRKIPTATILPETKSILPATTAVVKPVIKKTIPLKSSKIVEDEDIDEDELLADSPSPPSSPTKLSLLKTKPITNSGGGGSGRIATGASTNANAASGIFTNRRVVVRNTTTDTVTNDSVGVVEKLIAPSTGQTQHKGIFDRLEKKVIGVNEAAKRKIQRIVINNSE